jgi:hypothetical protein
MFHGDGEPDVSALLSTLRLIVSRPQDFSLSDISITVSMALEILDPSPPSVATRLLSHHCEGQMSLYDFLGNQ